MRAGKMHADEADIDATLVSRLLIGRAADGPSSLELLYSLCSASPNSRAWDRFHGDVDWGRPSAWIYLGFLILMVITGALATALIVRARRSAAALTLRSRDADLTI